MIVDMVFEMSLWAERYFFYGWRHVPHRGRIFIILSYLPHCQLATESSDKRRWQRGGGGGGGGRGGIFNAGRKTVSLLT